MKPRIVCITLAAVGAPLASFGVSYLTLEQAQQAIFPGATFTQRSFTLTREQRKAIESESGVKVRSNEVQAWRTADGEWLFVDEVLGKHEFITFALGLKADGTVKQIEVMDYREHYGGEVRNADWRSQFAGKKRGDALRLKQEIRNVSGATLSCQHLTEGVKRLLTTHGLVLKTPTPP